jgi:hypothetical protein
MSEAADPTAPAPSNPSEEEAWSLVLASWGDEAAHRAYLARFTDLEGFAVAGARYRAVLAERPQDPVALRMREELLRKATVVGLASLPRTPRRELPMAARRLIQAAVVVFAGFLVWAIYKLVVLLGARP